MADVSGFPKRTPTDHWLSAVHDQLSAVHDQLVGLRADLAAQRPSPQPTGGDDGAGRVEVREPTDRPARNDDGDPGVTPGVRNPQPGEDTVAEHTVRA